MAYAELHAHSNFSFLDGASHPEELAAAAVRLGLVRPGPHRPQRPLRGGPLRRGGPGLRAAHRLRRRAHHHRVRASRHLRTGVPDPDGTHLVVLARDPEGYARLSRVIAEAHLAGGEKGKPVVTLDAPGRPPRGPLADPHRVPQGGAGHRPHHRGPGGGRPDALDQLIGRFGRDHLAVELWDHGNPIDATRNDALALLATERGVTPVATNNVHYATPARFPLATALAAVRARRTLDDLEGWLPPSATACLRGEAEQRRRFARWPGVVERAAEIAAECAFDLRLVAPRLPDFPVPDRAHRADLAGRAGPPGGHRPLRAAERRAGAGGLGPARPRAGHHRRPRVPRLLPHRVGHRRRSAGTTTSSARVGARRPPRRSVTPSASPTSTPSPSACCSSASSPPPATDRRTSTSTSSRAGARRSSSTSTSATAGCTPPRWPT